MSFHSYIHISDAYFRPCIACWIAEYCTITKRKLRNHLMGKDFMVPDMMVVMLMMMCKVVMIVVVMMVFDANLRDDNSVDNLDISMASILAFVNFTNYTSLTAT